MSSSQELVTEKRRTIECVLRAELSDLDAFLLLEPLLYYLADLFDLDSQMRAAIGIAILEVSRPTAPHICRSQELEVLSKP